VPYGDIAVHLRGGTIVPMQEPALVTRDVRLSPITLVVALPAPRQASSASSAVGALPPYSQDEACAGAYSRSPDQLVSCGYIFMDSGEELQVTRDNSIQVSMSAGCGEDLYMGMYSLQCRQTMAAPARHSVIGQAAAAAAELVGCSAALQENGKQQAQSLGTGVQLPAVTEQWLCTHCARPLPHDYCDAVHTLRA
jgi:hypothetical protein